MLTVLPSRRAFFNAPAVLAAPAALVLVVVRVIDADRIETIERRRIPGDLTAARDLALRELRAAADQFGDVDVQVLDARTGDLALSLSTEARGCA